MNYQECSEIVVGLALEGSISPEHVSVSLVHPNYQEAIKLLHKGADPADFIDKVGTQKLLTLKSAANSVDKSYDWIAHLERAKNKEELADILDRGAKKLRQGGDVDSFSIISRLQDDFKDSKYLTLDKVKALDDAWQPTGYAPFDEYMGGIPKASLTLLAGPPGTGKTSLLLKIANSMVLSTAQKKVLLYSFEMTEGQIKKRLLEVNKISKETQQRFIVCPEVMDVSQMSAEATKMAAQEDLALIGIDFADLMSIEEDSEQAVGMVYRKCATLAKKTKVPVILLSQLNRQYVSGIPRIHNIRWSGLAEAMAAMIVLLYNPNQIWADQGKDNRLPPTPDHGYLIFGKSRFGFKEGGVGAAQIEWKGDHGWGDEPRGWFALGNVT